MHRWMYDRYSLGHLLCRVRLKGVRPYPHDESGIEGWRDFGLDTEPDGRTYKPQSLYLEGTRA